MLILAKHYTDYMEKKILSHGETREPKRIKTLNIKKLCGKKWKVHSVDLRDRLGNLIQSSPDVVLMEAVTNMDEVSLEFLEDGTFSLKGLPEGSKEIKGGTLSGTYRAVGSIVILTITVGKNKIVKIAHVLIQEDNKLVFSSGTQAFLAGAYGQDDFQFEDTLTLVPVEEETEEGAEEETNEEGSSDDSE